LLIYYFRLFVYIFVFYIFVECYSRPRLYHRVFSFAA